MSTASDAAQGFLNVVADPCLPKVGQLLFRLHELEAKPSDPTKPPEPVQAQLGIGLCKVVTPLKTVVFLRENPVIGIAAVVGFFGIFVGAGYKIGRRVEARRTKRLP